MLNNHQLIVKFSWSSNINYMQKMIRFCYQMFLIVIVISQIILQMLLKEAIAIQKQFKIKRNILTINHKSLQRIILFRSQLNLTIEFYIILNNLKIKTHFLHLMSVNHFLVLSHRIRFFMIRNLNNFCKIYKHKFKRKKN